MPNMLQCFTPGDTIYGYCQGYFGRDDYKNKVCVLVQVKYAVFEYEDGTATVVNYYSGIENDVPDWKDWKNRENEY